ncbi:MAG: hypothetical protein ACK5TQ_09965, partial [Acetobacteraceae bacterium]
MNTVDCLLPYFDRKSVDAVVKELESGGDTGEELPGRRILVNPQEVKPNPAIPEKVWEKLLALPSQTLPRRQARPVKRLTALAHELAVDCLLPDAGKKAHAEMHKVLDGAQVRYADEIKKTRAAVLAVEGKTVKIDVETKEMTFDDFVEAADYVVIEDAYRRAARIISPDLATSYSEHLASKASDDEDAEEALIDAHTAIAAMGLVPDIRMDLEAEAEKLANQWLNQYRVKIKNLTDERAEVYRQLREMSAHPQEIDLARPASWMQPMSIRDVNGQEIALPRFERHLLCAEDGLFPEDFNSWEGDVVGAELARTGTIGWYRNPARTSQDSLGIIYMEGDEAKIVRPDFIFFSKLANASVVADLVDPHGIQFADALPKLKGIARYAEKCGHSYRRIDVIAKIGDKLRVLDLQEASVR